MAPELAEGPAATLGTAAKWPEVEGDKVELAIRLWRRKDRVGSLLLMKMRDECVIQILQTLKSYTSFESVPLEFE